MTTVRVPVVLALVVVTLLGTALVAPAWAATPPAPRQPVPSGPAAPSEPADDPGAAEEEQRDPADDCRGLRALLPRCATQNARAAIGAGVNTVTAGVFEQLYIWVATGVSWLLSKLVAVLDSSTSVELGAGWFGRHYSAMAGLAMLLVLPLLLVATIGAVLRHDWSGLARCYLVYLPAAGIGTGLAIPLVDIGIEVTDWMSGLFLGGMRGDLESFFDTIAGALLTASAGATPDNQALVAGMPLFVGFVAAVVIALGAFAVWVELVLRAAGIYVAVFFLPLGFAALVWPATRGWFGRLVKAIVALVLSKFVIVAVLALAAAALGSAADTSLAGNATADTSLASAVSGDDGGDGGFGGVIAGAALMLMAAFSPLVLFRLADVAGDQVAGAFAGATQGRTSPVPVPDARRSAASVYGRIMRDRAGASSGAGGGGGWVRRRRRWRPQGRRARPPPWQPAASSWPGKRRPRRDAWGSRRANGSASRPSPIAATPTAPAGRPLGGRPGRRRTAVDQRPSRRLPKGETAAARRQRRRLPAAPQPR